MNQLDPIYLSALAAQVGSLSAFLGGFAATFLGTLLALGKRDRTTGVAIGFVTTSSVAFIVTVVASTLLVAVLHPQAPDIGTTSPTSARAVMGLGFFVGLYTLLLSLALSGWTRSRRTGLATSLVSGIGLILVTWLVASAG